VSSYDLFEEMRVDFYCSRLFGIHTLPSARILPNSLITVSIAKPS
jgi:hypothetical protein